MSNPFDLNRGYEAFLQHCIERFWQSELSTKLDLIALLLAGREAWRVALDSAAQNSASILKGAAGIAGVTVVLRSVLSGPIGLVLAGVSVGSLGALYAKHYERIWNQVDLYKKLVDEYRPKYATVVGEEDGVSFSEEQRDLMLEGLASRFVQRLESLPHATEK